MESSISVKEDMIMKIERLETIQALEIQMWEAARNRDKEAFLNIVSEDAVMICGGYRCTGAEYAQIIEEFDCKDYMISDFEVVAEDNDLIQVHYMITTTVNDEANKDLAGTFTAFKHCNDSISNICRRLFSYNK